jgi:hypothetical protein
MSDCISVAPPWSDRTAAITVLALTMQLGVQALRLLAELHLQCYASHGNKLDATAALSLFCEAHPELDSVNACDIEQGIPDEALLVIQQDVPLALALGHCYGILGKEDLAIAQALRRKAEAARLGSAKVPPNVQRHVIDHDDGHSCDQSGVPVRSNFALSIDTDPSTCIGSTLWSHCAA